MDPAVGAVAFGVLDVSDLTAICTLSCASRGWSTEARAWLGRARAVSLRGVREGRSEAALAHVVARCPSVSSIDVAARRVSSAALVAAALALPRLERLDVRGCPSGMASYARRPRKAQDYGPTSKVIAELDRSRPDLRVTTDPLTIRCCAVRARARDRIYMMRSTAPLSKLFLKFAQHENVQLTRLRFTFRGEEVDWNHTPADLGLGPIVPPVTRANAPANAKAHDTRQQAPDQVVGDPIFVFF